MNTPTFSFAGLASAVQSAGCGSFTAAALALNLTPAAVSKNVAALEAQLQVRLFNRTTRQLSLTEEGKAFVAQTREALSLLHNAAVQAGQGLQPRGLVRISSSAGFGRRYVLPALPAFYAQHPEVQVELSLNDQTVDLVREGFDVGVRGGAEPPQGMVARTICKLTAVLVATPQYLAQRGTPQHFSELARHDLLQVKYLSGRTAPWLFKERGKVLSFEVVPNLMLSDPEVILDAVLLHMGIARLGRHHAHAALQHGDLVELLPRQHLPGSNRMAMFYPHRAGLAPRVRVLVDFLMAQFAANAALQGRAS